MIELLAIPSWQSPPRPLDDWIAELSSRTGHVEVERESTGVCWLEVGSLRLRGYAVLDGVCVDAINFELNDPDPGPALLVIEAAAQALGYEVHLDDPDDDSDDDDV